MEAVQERQEAKSMRGRIWEIAKPDPSVSGALRANGAAPSVARILAARGVGAAEYASFMDPKIRDLMPDPYFFLDMQAGVERIADAINRGQRIGIWSDYDVDGATSAGVLGRFLKMCGHTDIVLRIPDRITEGYGPNVPGMLSMKHDELCDVVCILDAGTVAFEPLEAARGEGLDIVVVDHHAAEDAIPPAIAVINPNRKDQEPGFGHLCAAGMTFIFCVGVARKLRNEGYFKERGGTPDLMTLLDLVALGTVCDVVPLTTLNRAFVTRGLPMLTARNTPGIAALAAAAGLEPAAPITEKECGWVLGPRINAGGRIADSSMGAHLLLEEDPAIARGMAERLDAINTERRELEVAATEAALAQHAGRVTGTDRRLALSVVDAHEGVVGISASRLKDAFDAPAIVLTKAHDGTLKGSARSVPGFDIGHAIIEARHRGLIVKGGGHGMAGGLTLTSAQLPAFIEFMNDEIAQTDYWHTGVHSHADLQISLQDLDVKLIDAMDGLRPFGMGNSEPTIVLGPLVLSEIRCLKEKHYKLILRDGAREIDAMMWGVVGTRLGGLVDEARGRMVEVLGKPQVNEFRGNRKPQIIVDDLRLAPGSLL